jgi:hypothetical protein
VSASTDSLLEGVEKARRIMEQRDSPDVSGPQFHTYMRLMVTTDDVIAIASALLSLVARDDAGREEWQPIETAPKGGTWILLWWERVTDAPFAGYHSRGQWCAAPSGDVWGGAGPTHWRPLPSPPES